MSKSTSETNSKYVLFKFQECQGKSKDIFTRIECLYGPISNCLKEILRNCGFDNALVVELIDEHAIKDMESFMQENGKGIIDTLNCCNSDKYKGQDVFVFTPGHKRTILAIAEKAREFNQTAVQQHSDKNETAIAPDLTGMEHQLTSTSSDQSQESPPIEPDVQAASGCSRSSEKISATSRQLAHANENPVSTNPSSEAAKELKSMLILKLQAALKPKLNDIEDVFKIDETHVAAMNITTINQNSNGSCKCMCPFCGSSVQASCNNGRWKISNVVRHIVNHFDSKKPIVNGKMTAPHVGNSRKESEENSATDDSGAKNYRFSENVNVETDELNQNHLDILKEFDPLTSLL